MFTQPLKYVNLSSDGSENYEIHLEGLEDYEVDTISDDEDPFADLIDGNLATDSSDEED